MTTRRILAVSIMLLLVLAGLTAFLAVNQRVTVYGGRAAARQSRDVVQATTSLYAYMADLESSQRGYLLTGDAGFLRLRGASQTAIAKTIGQLRTLAGNDPDLTAKVNQVADAVDQRLAIGDAALRLYRPGLADKALSQQLQASRSSTDRVRTAVSSLIRSQQHQFVLRRDKFERDDWISFVVAVTVGGLAVAGLAVSVAWMAVINNRLVHEVGERRAAEAAQRQSEARYQAVFANTADYHYVIEVGDDGVFRIAEVNPAYERATGRTTADLRGADIRELGDEAECAARVANLQRVVDKGEPVSLRDTITLTLANSTRIWETILVPVRGETGRVELIVGSSRDVTEREHAEEELRRAHRLEAVGHLTGGVAHDFNNLLQVIRGNLELIAAEIDDREPTAQRLKNALHGANRAAQLTRQLLAFARRQPLEPKVVNLGRLVTDMAEMLRATLGESVAIESVIPGGLWNTLADPAQVESAILNLAINARDAMPDGGKLTIEIANAELDEAYTAGEPELEAGQYVMIAVSDTGAGMPPETVARVFEPFFTTKSEEKGTGLGLSMVYGFVKQSRGHAQIVSKVGQGTTVKIYLPRSDAPEVAAPSPAIGSPRGRSEVILVVEDDDLVRASAVGMLRDLGYTCLHASDGAAALATLKSGAKVDLLFTDVIMPGPVKSRDLAGEAQRLRPGLPVLFTSGYTDDAIVHHGRLDEGVYLLSKPYTQADLAQKIGGLLKAQRPVVLVVEDDALVRLSAVDMVEALGFAALSAQDGETALEIVRGEGRIDVLFTDVGLPGMRGPELAVEAAALRPGLKIVFASGYGDVLGEALAGAVQLGKPYEQDQLAEVLGAAA